MKLFRHQFPSNDPPKKRYCCQPKTRWTSKCGKWKEDAHIVTIQLYKYICECSCAWVCVCVFVVCVCVGVGRSGPPMDIAVPQCYGPWDLFDISKCASAAQSHPEYGSIRMPKTSRQFVWKRKKCREKEGYIRSPWIREIHVQDRELQNYCRIFTTFILKYEKCMCVTR